MQRLLILLRGLFKILKGAYIVVYSLEDILMNISGLWYAVMKITCANLLLLKIKLKFTFKSIILPKLSNK